MEFEAYRLDFSPKASASEDKPEMRYKIWITLIICGTFLVIAPPLSDYLMNYQVSHMLLERKDFNSVNFGVLPMSSQYRFGCWALGAGMILVGVIGGWREESSNSGNEGI